MEYYSYIKIYIFVNIWNMVQVLRARLADNIKFFREKHNYKREELSLMLGVDNSYISKLEKCKVNITIDKLEQLANIFNIEPIELIKNSK